MAYTVRSFRDDDAEALADLLVRAIEQIGPQAYSARQIAAWASRHPGPARLRERARRGDSIFVVSDVHDRPVAYALLEPDGHLDHLYTDPDYTRRGLAAKLLAACDQYARTRGIARLYTEASELARPAFERAGYRVLEKREFTIAHAGRDVPIHNWAMEKSLR